MTEQALTVESIEDDDGGTAAVYVLSNGEKIWEDFLGDGGLYLMTSAGLERLSSQDPRAVVVSENIEAMKDYAGEGSDS